MGNRIDDAATPPGAQLLGREWIGFDESGQALIRFQAQSAFTNRHGTIQGGFLAAMLDSATGICVDDEGVTVAEATARLRVFETK